MSDEKLVPKLRFSGFNNNWNSYYLQDVIQFFINGKTPSRNVDSYWNGNINWVSSGELNYKYITSTIEKITTEGKNNANLKLLSPGTFLMAITGLEAYGTRGSCAILGIEATTNQSCMALIPKKDKLTTKFLYYWYLKVGEHYGIKYTQGTKQQSYNKELLEKLPIILPNTKEQDKITDFLSLINYKIELLEKKHQYYQDFKKYLMQQIFAQELRFDFKDEWKQYKLKDLLTVKSSSISFNQLDDNIGTYPLYGASGFLKNIDFCEMEMDYISIVKDGSGVGNLSYHEKNSSIVNTSQYLLPKKNFDIHFLYYLLQTLNLLKYVNGSSIPHIYFKDYCIEKVEVPSLSEQEQIGKLFVNADKTLKNISNCIQVTQEFKNGLLQQMFV